MEVKIVRLIVTAVFLLQLNERSIHDSLVNIPPHVTKSDFHTLIYSVLSCLISFHCILSKTRQVTVQHYKIAAVWKYNL